MGNLPQAACAGHEICAVDLMTSGIALWAVNESTN